MLAGGLAAGATSRLLPASVPYRFFTAAAVFQLLHYLLLLASVDELTDFRGGTGPVLAAIHSLTMGVLVMTAIGASLQLLPVATRRPVASVSLIRLCWWLFTPGSLLLVAGMASWSPGLASVGAAAATLGIAVFALLLGINLLHARGLGPVGAHAAAALLALLVLTGLGILLLAPPATSSPELRTALALSHLVVANYGFMGLLAMGFSYLLLPMFALSPAIPARPAVLALLLAVLAIALALPAIAFDIAALKVSAVGVGLAAVALHLYLLLNSLRRRMRRRLGPEFVLVFAAWAWLVMSLLLAALWATGKGGAGVPSLFGFALLVGWLQTFVLAVLQRIVPFLASMHLPARRPPPLLSELTAKRPQQLHLCCHFAMQSLLIAGLLLEQSWLLRSGAVAGFLGAFAFLAFIAHTLRHLRAAGGNTVGAEGFKS